jgi:hypothetical protein
VGNRGKTQWTPERRARQAEIARRIGSDPEVARRRAATNRARNLDKMRESGRRLNALRDTPEGLERWLAGLRAAAVTPEALARATEHMLRMRDDPQFMRKLRDGLRSPKHRALCRERMLAKRFDPEFIELMLDGISKVDHSAKSRKGARTRKQLRKAKELAVAPQKAAAKTKLATKPRRAAADHVDLTAFAFGDPLPGRSALDHYAPPPPPAARPWSTALQRGHRRPHLP